MSVANISCADNCAPIINCGTVQDCYFRCGKSKAFQGGFLNAQNASNLIVSSSADECMKQATINLPNNGNASFTMTAQKSFKEITVNAGPNTQNIFIDCSFGNGDECKTMQMNAESAQYLEIRVDGVGSELNEFAVVNCPRHSSYQGPEIAPCIIDASNGGRLIDVTVHTLFGMPQDVWIKTDDQFPGTLDNVVITCNNQTGSSLNFGDTFFQQGDCWLTPAPTIETTVPITTTTITATTATTSEVAENPTEPRIKAIYQPQTTPINVAAVSPPNTTKTNMDVDLFVDAPAASTTSSNLDATQSVIIAVLCAVMVLCFCMIAFVCYKKRKDRRINAHVHDWFKQHYHHHETVHHEKHPTRLEGEIPRQTPGPPPRRETVELEICDEPELPSEGAEASDEEMYEPMEPAEPTPAPPQRVEHLRGVTHESDMMALDGLDTLQMPNRLSTASEFYVEDDEAKEITPGDTNVLYGEDKEHEVEQQAGTHHEAVIVQMHADDSLFDSESGEDKETPQ